MTDAGFFRGTSADQDNRFANKQKKLLKNLNFSPILNTKLNMSKINVESLKPWIESKIKDVLEKDDEILSESIYEHLAEKEPDGKNILMLITGFVDEDKASKFMEDLWTKLIDLQENSNGVDKASNDSEAKSKDSQNEATAGDDKLIEGNNNSKNDHTIKDSPKDGSNSSRSTTPPSRSVSKSPGNHKLDEHSRGRPRKRLLDDSGSREGSKEGSRTRVEKGDPRDRSRSHSRSKSRSHTPSRKSPVDAPGDRPLRRRSRSGSSSRSRRGSRSQSRSRSRSGSYSRSRSSSRSPRHRSRSPQSHSYRNKRSRSRSRGPYRPRSRSPRARRGFFGGPRGSYRGSFGYQDRRRGGGFGGPMRRRTSPWGRRRFSPRSPSRRRRSPSFSPRNRRTPSPYGRRYSRSRSPPGHHATGRNISPPRQHIVTGGHFEPVGNRHLSHHDMHRQLAPIQRSPRGLPDHRNYGDGPMLPRPSPGALMSKPSDLLPAYSHQPNNPSSAAPGLQSPPSSSKKKHKKEKKHRKHKKSKKRHSESPERKRKHKKHKKSKKHKSH